MEEEYSIEDLGKIKKVVIDIRVEILQPLFNRDHHLDIVNMYHNASLENEEELDKLTHELESTQEGLQESRFHIDQLHRELIMPQPPSCMENELVHMLGETSGFMEEPHVGDKHEENYDL